LTESQFGHKFLILARAKQKYGHFYSAKQVQSY
jgi:hypothetical protein